MENYIAGKNAVLEVLRSDRQVSKVLVAEKGTFGEVFSLAKRRGVGVQTVSRAWLDKLCDENHQGVAALVPPFEYAELADIMHLAESKDEEPFIVVLDHIEDPHNLGAIIRTADAAGVHGIIIPKKRAAGVTAAVEKVSAGAASFVSVARVANIPQAIEALKKEGVWTYCASMGGKSLYAVDLSGPAALVIGSEGGGVSEIVRKKCDFEISIPMYGRITSLNASVAAGIALYEIVRRRKRME